MYYVYALIDPINGIPFYIGKGKGNRAFTHLNGTDRNKNSRKDNMIKTIRLLGHEPIVEYFIENLTDESYAYDLEYSLISCAVKKGIKLTNKVGVDLRPPCRRGTSVSEETKRKISIATKGIKKSKSPSTETRKKMSMARMGKPHIHALKIEKDLLEDLYLNKNMSRKQIADHFNVSLYPINRLLNKFQIYKMQKQ